MNVRRLVHPAIVVLAALPQAQAPRFEAYPATVSFQGRPAAPDLTSVEGARRFRTVLKRGAVKGPNFAGAYTVVLWGCGTSCQNGAIIDARTGRVSWLPSTLARRAAFRIDSRLLVLDPPAARIQPYESAFAKYYEWRDESFVFIDSLPVINVGRN